MIDLGNIFVIQLKFLILNLDISGNDINNEWLLIKLILLIIFSFFHLKKAGDFVIKEKT